MIIKRVVVGDIQENCYLVGDKDEIIVIDPGSEPEKIIKVIEDNNYKVKYIVLSHCHYDHMGAVREVKEKTGATFLVFEKEKANYMSKRVNLSEFFGEDIPYVEPDRILKEGDTIKSGEFEFEVIHTPGHTSGGICLYTPGHISGGICLYTDGHLFSGDTLFEMSIGRTDFPTGNMGELLSSVRTKLFVLPDETNVYAGHGESTTIGFEKKNNMFF